MWPELGLSPVGFYEKILGSLLESHILLKGKNCQEIKAFEKSDS